MMCLKHCSVSSCHKSEMMSPYVSNFEFQKKNQRARAKRNVGGYIAWNPRYPSFSDGFLRVFYGLLRVFYGVPEIQQLGTIFSKKNGQYQCGTVIIQSKPFMGPLFIQVPTLVGLDVAPKSPTENRHQIHRVIFSGNLHNPGRTHTKRKHWN